MPDLPFAFILLVLCFTPLIFWPPFIRSFLYSTLAMSKIFAGRSWPLPEPRPWGLKIWDWTHTHSVFIATLSIPVGAPAIMFFVLNLSETWRMVPTGRLEVVQLLSATIFGAVAVSIFLSLQLPRILRPRIHCCFLISDPQSIRRNYFLGHYEVIQEFVAGLGQWVHVRITNVGTVKYSGLGVTCKLPEGWNASGVIRTNIGFQVIDGLGDFVDTSSGSLPRFIREYEFHFSTRDILFEPNNDSRETGSGASSIYSFYVLPPRFPGEGTLEVHVTSDEAVGATVKKLNVVVNAGDASSLSDD